MKNAIIILNYNDWTSTQKLVDYIKEYSIIDKIVIVDNNSKDDSYEQLLKLQDDKIDVIKTENNGGYAAGNNYGANYAIKMYSPEYLIIANPDVIFDENAIKKMLEVYEIRQKAGLVTCKMKCTSSIHILSSWKLPTLFDCIVEQLFAIKKVFGNRVEYSDEYLKNNISSVDVVAGSLFVMPSLLFEKIGGFDEETFLYYEENILAYKIKKLGYQNYQLNSIEYLHNHSVSINKSIQSVEDRLKMAYDSRRLYCSKYLKCNKLYLMLLKVTFELGLLDYKIYLKIRNR